MGMMGNPHDEGARARVAPGAPKRGRRVLARLGAVGAVAGGVLVFGAASGSAGSTVTPHAPSVPSLTLAWSVHVADGATKIALSSPNLDRFASGGPAVVVGDRTGRVYAYSLTNGGTPSGRAVPGFPVVVGAPVTSTPSVVPSGPLAGTIAVGTGSAGVPCAGGYDFIRPTHQVSVVPETNPVTDAACTHNGVQASMAVGTLQRREAVVAGSLGQYEDALTVSAAGTLGTSLTGFPWFQADSNFSTPAIADLYGTGGTEIVEGGASTAGLALGGVYTNGGHIRILSGTGNYGTGAAAGGLVCEVTTGQQVTSSPAVGPFLATGAEGIAVGTGTYWPGGAGTDQIYALRPNCSIAWTDILDGPTTSSPALADVMGTGGLEVLEATTTGTVYALNGANGSVIWSARIPGVEVFGSLTAANLGGGHADVLLAAANGFYILTGQTGAQLGNVVQPNTAFQNAPLVTDDPDGDIGITLAGYQATGSYIFHYVIGQSTGAGAVGRGDWPGFHDTPALRGVAGTGPDGAVACNAPRPGTANGYLLAAADGGIFDFSTGTIPFCGSTGGIPIDGTVVAITATPTAGGYFEVESNGGVYAFGTAQFHGSMGGRPLNRPIVGMAEDPKTGGYWLVASDGGIFAFTAPFYGSMGGTPLNRPIVGMAATPTGEGYYLVASDGGIFAFSATGAHPAAAFHGSMGGRPLNAPVVGMAVDPATGGYWEVGSDGGVFAFTAPFYGSTGNLSLVRPIVAMTQADNGNGYWFVASDGGVFAFHLAFYGSMGGKPLNRPVIAVTGAATGTTPPGA